MAAITLTVDGQFLFGAAAFVIALTGLLAQMGIRKQLAKASTDNLAATAAVHAEVKPNNGMTSGETNDAVLTKLIQMQPGEPSTKDDAHMVAMEAKDPELAAHEGHS